MSELLAGLLDGDKEEKVKKITDEPDVLEVDTTEDLLDGDVVLSETSDDSIDLNQEDYSGSSKDAKARRSNVEDMRAQIERKLKGIGDDGELSKDVIRTTADVRREHFGDERIIPIGDRPEFKTVGERQKEVYNVVYNAFRAGNILTGRIVAGDTTDDRPVAIVMYEDTMPIKIPLPVLTDLKRRNTGDTPESSLAFDRRMVNERIGSEVEFKVLQVDGMNMYAIGDRVAAMNDRRIAHFVGKGRRNPLVKEGDILEGRVCFVTASRVCVEAGGVEKVLREGQCLWFRTNDLRDYFAAGQRVPVKVMKCELESRDGKAHLSIEFSIKEAEPNPKQKYFDLISENSTLLGHITQINEIGVFVKVLNMDYDILCSPSKEFVTPPIGTKVSVGVHSKNAENCTVKGYLIRRIG